MDEKLIGAIEVDFKQEVQYDGVFDKNMRRHATLEFVLQDAKYLYDMINRQRVKEGFLPEEETEPVQYSVFSGWYNLYLVLTDMATGPVQAEIEAVVVGSFTRDNEMLYAIPLTKEEQAAVVKKVNEQCEDALGESVESMMEISRQYLFDEAV